VEGIWAQVIQRVPDALATHLKNAENLAISGPNVLEVRFPRSYLFSMNYCQRPEPRGQLVRIIEELVGKRVEVRCCIDTSTEVRTQASSTRGGRGDEGRLRPKLVENDPFVQQAVAIFGGAVVDVRKVLDPPRPSGPPSSDSELEVETDPPSTPDTDDDD
jgi:DNA polymerase-3 subunit gamma/tau